MRQWWNTMALLAMFLGTTLLTGQDNEELKKMVLQQQHEIKVLKQEIQTIKEKQKTSPDLASPKEQVKPSPQEQVKPSPEEQWEHPLQAKIGEFKVTVLGFIYAQFAYDNHDPIQRHLSVLGRNIGNDSTRFDMDTTRVGLAVESDLTEWQSKLKGLLEIDFRPGDESEPVGPVRFRHAYVEFQNPYVNVLIGQTWTIVSQNGPDTINNDWLFHLGNPGDRFPQFRLSKDWEVGPGLFTLQMGASHFNDFAPEKNSQIQQFGSTQYEFRRYFPQFQTRAAFKWDREAAGYAAVGFSTGPLHIIDPSTGERERVTHWWFASELHIPLGPVTLSGELWLGQGIGYGASMGQAIVIVEPKRGEAIPAIGGWGQVTFHPTKTVRVNALFGVDDSESRVNGIKIDKDINFTYLGNVIWDILPYWTTAVEYQYVATRYGDGDRPNNSRVVFATLLKF